MNLIRRLKKPQDLPNAQDVQDAASPPGHLPTLRRNRRGIFGLLKTGLSLIVATTGATVLSRTNSNTAYADTVGTFSSSSSTVPAVTATGTNGAIGIQASSDTSTAVLASSTVQQGAAVVGSNTSIGTGVYGYSLTTTNGFVGASSSEAGVLGASSAGNGVLGTSGTGYGVSGYSQANIGTYGRSRGSIGVYGTSDQYLGAYFTSPSVLALFAYSPSGTGLYAAGSPTAASFAGNVSVSGTLSKGGGSFLIDHPQDPANKNLSHSFVESPDMKNIYDGVVQLDSKGEASVTLPAWFESLNSDFRYQLTAIGGAAPNLYLAQKIQNNQFTIAGGVANTEVSWQVTGIRQDAWAKAYRIPVEADKPASQKGQYHYPELYGEPKEKAIGYHPQPKV
jgi:hypothetical protein